MDANLNVIRDYIEHSYGNNSGRNAARAAVDALSQLARPVPHHQRLGEALSEYFGKLDSIEGIRAPEGRILRAFDYCDSRNLDDLIDRAILPALTASIEQHEAAPGGYCERAGGCVCGGDLPRVREGCSEWVKLEAAQSAPLEGTGNGADAWMTEDGRVISDAQKQGALRDGGASASSVRPFSIELCRRAPRTEVAGAVPLGSVSVEALCARLDQFPTGSQIGITAMMKLIDSVAGMPPSADAAAPPADERAAFERHQGYPRPEYDSAPQEAWDYHRKTWCAALAFARASSPNGAAPTAPIEGWYVEVGANGEHVLRISDDHCSDAADLESFESIVRTAASSLINFVNLINLVGAGPDHAAAAEQEAVEAFDYDDVVSICDAHGIGLPVDCIEMVVEIVRHAAPPARVATRQGLTEALRQAREELSNVEWENDPPARVTNLFSKIDALLEGDEHE